MIPTSSWYEINFRSFALRWYCHCNVKPEKARTDNRLFLFEVLIVQLAELSILIEQTKTNNNNNKTTNKQNNQAEQRDHETIIVSLRLLSALRQIPPKRNMGPKTETPQEGTWHQAARQEVISYKDPPVILTDASKNITLPQNSFAGGKYWTRYGTLR